MKSNVVFHFDSVESSCIRASIRVEILYDDFVKVMQDRTVCFHLFSFYREHFPRSRKNEIWVPLSTMGVWKSNQKSIVDECASHVTIFVQALSLELAAPAINYLPNNYTSSIDYKLN